MFVQFNGTRMPCLAMSALRAASSSATVEEQLVGLGVALVLSLLRNDHAPGHQRSARSDQRHCRCLPASPNHDGDRLATEGLIRNGSHIPRARPVGFRPGVRLHPSLAERIVPSLMVTFGKATRTPAFREPYLCASIAPDHGDSRMDLESVQNGAVQLRVGRLFWLDGPQAPSGVYFACSTN